MGGLSGLLVIDGLAGLLPRAWEGVTQRQFALRDVQTSGNAIVAEDDIAIPGTVDAARQRALPADVHDAREPLRAVAAGEHRR